MKAPINRAVRNFAILLLLGSSIVADYAQETASYAKVSDFEIELQALEATTPMPANALPDSSKWHGFYSVQNPNSPPMPGDILNLPVWPLGNGFLGVCT